MQISPFFNFISAAEILQISPWWGGINNRLLLLLLDSLWISSQPELKTHLNLQGERKQLKNTEHLLVKIKSHFLKRPQCYCTNWAAVIVLSRQSVFHKIRFWCVRRSCKVSARVTGSRTDSELELNIWMDDFQTVLVGVGVGDSLDQYLITWTEGKLRHHHATPVFWWLDRQSGLALR